MMEKNWPLKRKQRVHCPARVCLFFLFKPWIWVLDPAFFFFLITKVSLNSHTTTGLNQTPTSKDTPMETPIQVEDSDISPSPSTMSTRLVSDSTNLVFHSRNGSPMVKWSILHSFWILMGKLVINPNVAVTFKLNPAFCDDRPVIGLRSYQACTWTKSKKNNSDL